MEVLLLRFGLVSRSIKFVSGIRNLFQPVTKLGKNINKANLNKCKTK